MPTSPLMNFSSSARLTIFIPSAGEGGDPNEKPTGKKYKVKKSLFYLSLFPITLLCLPALADQNDRASQTAQIGSGEGVHFPSNFGWCIATAAHQIEGENVHSDHYVWETASINRVLSSDLVPNPWLNQGPVSSLARNEHACPSFDFKNDPDPAREHSALFISPEDREPKLCEISGKSIDHWNRVSTDIALMKNLGIKEYRMSVEWAKIEPIQGQFNQAALDHYTDEIRQLADAGIEPQVTLFHFTMPQWLREKGGWENSESPADFRKFSQVAYAAFGPSVHTWYTFNEPMVHVTAGYIAGVLPPGVSEPLKLPRVLGNILRAHAAAYHVIHDGAAMRKSFVRVGVAHHLRVFDPLTQKAKWNQPKQLIKKEVETAGAYIADYLWNWMFFDAIETGRFAFDFEKMNRIASAKGFQLPTFLNFHPVVIEGLEGSQDFLGLNYYSRDLIQFDFSALLSGKLSVLNAFKTVVNPEAIKAGDVNDVGWEIYPEGFYRILKSLDARGMLHSTVRRQIIVSENGIADSKDLKREQFLRDHLRAMNRAIHDGIPVVGYCHWTLVDNFEWNSGYSPKFGLYDVDLKTQRRHLRPSGQWFASTIRNSGWDE